ncbi:metabotropic glutamate receptor-like protein P [Dysidea avara]|uniref:metabotropic glutamate receptor-like protein P n=1 Tax=Dysidea avara TaxID=196820 RepID=UPI00331FDFC7
MPDRQSWNSGDEDFSSGSGGGKKRGQDKLKLPCCVSGNFTFHSIDDILNNISSDNTIVNITTDVVLSSNVILEGLENIMIIGHRNPVVKCNDVGAVKFISCKNITIEGIQWEECGSDYPGIEFYNSSNVSFARCSFQNSKGKSVLLSEVSGNVHINNCNFTHNNEYSGHGAAILYLLDTNSSESTKYKLVIQNCKFIFNRATQSVVYIDGSGSRIPGHVCLQDNVFVNNTGVPIYISHTKLHIRGSVLFKGNTANSGGGIYSNNSNIIFYDKSDVNFISNSVTTNGGAIYQIHSTIIFEEHSMVTFKDHSATYGGALHSDNSDIIFDGNSSVTFNNNTARYGGAVFCWHSSNITFDGNSSVTFNNNEASDDGGAVYCNTQCIALFYATTMVTFINNSAITGGAIFGQSSYISAKETSTVQFIHNSATHGGAIFLRSQATVLLEGSCVIAFKDNKATESGGALYITAYSTALFTGHSEVTCSNNEVTQYGGAIYCGDNSNISLDENVTVKFTNNTSEYGGALSITHSILTFNGNSLANFTNNIAERGGALYVLLSSVTLEGNIAANFTENKAENGGAISIVKSSVTFTGNSQTQFFSNSAAGNGGAMHLSDHFTVNISHISHNTFYHNTANRHGGAIYCDLTKSSNNKLTFNTTDIIFYSNTDLTSSDVYVDIPTSCDETCLNNSIIKKDYSQFGGVINTSPRELQFIDSAVTCIDYDNDTNCQTYLTKNIMLGQEIIINACVLDYFNQPAGSTQFVLSSDGHDHHIIGSDNVLISCTVFEGVSVTGKRVVEATNYSINITSYDGSISDLKKFTVELITELSPCHPGFQYDITTQTCVCYSDSDIVSCSGSTSSIKRGYWFGEVNDKATVTICPNSYCNFTCCETANGFFKLSPVRANQCNSQRSGTACGSCKKDYTLSFDSVECVSVDNCTTFQLLLVVILSVIYWVTLVIAVFAMMYYRIGIGYLYAITYYYSIVDIILIQNLYTTPALFTTVSIVSSIAKVTPQFLGQLCLIQNMSGIDQQFIHYIHPLAVTFILAVICISARISYKFSSLVRRGIIHVICFLLLLSYTSVATTSLLIVRPLKFTIGNTVQVKTYLSPDIDYFQGRHLPYAIVAILCTLSIVIGLPLLLLLEPFLNRKINFIRIKPLLDQFQGCYKDKCRFFAAYYMICRLVIIAIFISNFSNNNTMQYLMLAVSAVFALIHFVQKPYVNKTLNLFDGLVLVSVTFIAMIPLIDDSGLDLLLTVTVLFPLVSFIGLIMLIHRKNIKKIMKYFKPTPQATNNNVEIPMREYGVVVDDNMRNNATIREISDQDTPDNPESDDERYIHYHDSFIEVMNKIED